MFDLLEIDDPLALLELLESREVCEESLIEFLRQAWPCFDPAPLVINWHMEVVAEHLEAVSRGEIKRLLINIPPRTGKTSLCAIAWPVWTWTQKPDPEYPLLGPGVRFLCASYGATKAQQDGVTARRLIASPWFQQRWGDRVVIAKDRDNQEEYDTTAGGSRISTGIPESLGKGGMIRMIDDPHKTQEAESELVRAGVIRAYDEVWRTRSNDPQEGVEVVIMQRLADGDLSGHLLEEDDVVHLMLPMEHDPARHCVTSIGFSDPRTEDGELLWPDRFDAEWCATQRRKMGPYAWAAQMQQSPAPRGGGIVKREWWQLWPPRGEEERWTDEQGRVRFPSWELVVAYLDTAFTQKDENAWCAFTRWGVFELNGVPKVMLASAWRDRPTLRGLVDRVIDSCRKGKVDTLVIENRAGAEWVRQEIMQLMRAGEWSIVLDEPRGDKVARLHSVTPLFEGGVIYAPERQWADMTIDEVQSFPKGRFKDLVDCTSGALGYLRRNGLIQLQAEHEDDERERRTFRGRPESVAEMYGV